MSGFWKKVAGAFVVVEGDGAAQTSGGDGGMDVAAEIADTQALLDSLGEDSSPTAVPDPLEIPLSEQATAVHGVPGVIDEGVTFDDMYVSSQVPPSPFPAEKLLKVLDGLAAMPPETRRAAITAMDAADDQWTVEDAVLDSQRKMDVLQNARQDLVSRLTAAEHDGVRRLDEADAYLEQATTTIHDQIRELEQLLANEREGIAQRKRDIQAHVDAVRAAARREDSRLEAEIRRLSAITRTFGALPQE